MTKKLSSSQRLGSVERKGLGAYYTPRVLTDFGVGWALSQQSRSVLDPGCGDGAFLISAAERLRAEGVRINDVTIAGIDLNPDAIATARRELEEAGVEGPKLHCANFFEVACGSGGFDQVDALVGNPPYVRYQLFRDENRAAGLRAAARAGVILPALTSSWAPFVVHATTFLRPGGRLALVLPGELLHVGYAAAVREFLLRNFSELTLVTFEEKVFPGALEEVVLVLGVKGHGDGTLRVLRLGSLDDLHSGPSQLLRHARQCRVGAGERWLATLLEEGAAGAAAEYLIEVGYQALGDLARVDIGVVTGANDFFVLNRHQISENRLPFSVLLPAISKANHVQGTTFTFSDWTRQLDGGDPSYLLVADSDHGSPAVARYLLAGEQAGLAQRYKCRVREPWYRVPYVRKPDLFLTYMSNIAPRLVVNEAGATNTNTVHGVFLRDPLLAEALAASFLNSGTLLSAEIEGRSYGGGVLKLEPGEAVKLLVPRLTSKLCVSLNRALPRLDALVRSGRIDEASAIVDGLVFGPNQPRARLEEIRAVLSTLRARRLGRARSKIRK